MNEVENMLKRWIIVADAASARFLQQSKNGTISEALTELLAIDVPAIREHDYGVHKPGKATSSGTGLGVRHRFEPHTPWNDAKRDLFCAEIVKVLHQHQQQFDILTLIAPPKVLGSLRSDLDKSLSKKVEQEVAKDLTKATSNELKEYVNLPRFIEK